MKIKKSVPIALNKYILHIIPTCLFVLYCVITFNNVIHLISSAHVYLLLASMADTREYEYNATKKKNGMF